MKKLHEKIKNMNEKNRKIFFLSVIVFSVLLLLGVTGLTYAWFSATVSGNDTAKGAVVETGVLSIKYTNGNEIKGENILPGWTMTKTFTVENTGTVPATYKINWENLTNTFVNKSDLVYTLTSTNSGGTLSETQIPNTGEHVNILDNITIPSGVIQTYTLTITYKNRNADQSSDMGKKLLGKIEVLDINVDTTFPFSWSVAELYSNTETIFEYTKGEDNINEMILDSVKDIDGINYKISDNTYSEDILMYHVKTSGVSSQGVFEKEDIGNHINFNLPNSLRLAQSVINEYDSENEGYLYGTFTKGFWIHDFAETWFNPTEGLFEYYKISKVSNSLFETIDGQEFIKIRNLPFDENELIGKTITMSGTMEGEYASQSIPIDESMIEINEGTTIIGGFAYMNSNGVYLPTSVLETEDFSLTIN